MTEPSDLRIDCGGTETLVGFSGQGERSRSELVTVEGQRLPSEGSLQVYGPHFQSLGTSKLDWRLAELVGGKIPTVDEPADLLLEKLVEIDASSSRKGGLLTNGERAFLLPLRSSALEVFGLPRVCTPEERIKSQVANIRMVVQGSTLEVELWIPVQQDRFVRAVRSYDSRDVLSLAGNTPRFMIWPDFQQDDWSDYFFYQSSGEQDFHFRPITMDGSELEPRHQRQRPGLPTAMWWRSESPLVLLVAVDSKRPTDELGIFSGPFGKALEKAEQSWKVSIDLGSTHTRIFYRRESSKREIRPLQIRPRGLRLTGRPGSFHQDFFALSESRQDDGTSGLEEIPTQVVLAKDIRSSEEKKGGRCWLPYDGVVVLGRIGQDFHYDTATARFSTKIKWSADSKESDRTTIFLSHLLLLARAEAAGHGAEVTSVGHSYPSSFPPILVDEFTERWQELLEGTGSDKTSNGIRDNGPEVEALAVAKYLTDRAGAVPQARMLAIDIGGSTSDIAIWQGGVLTSLESVRFAASAISTYWCLDEDNQWEDYCNLLESLECRVQTIGGARSLSDLPPTERLAYFYVSLGLLEQRKQLSKLIRRIRADDGHRRFLAHASFIYGALVYYLGMLSGSHFEPTDEPQDFDIHFCGKGSSFLKWIEMDGEWETLKEIFEAALGRAQGVAVGETRIHMSPDPKWEVGYGRTVEARSTERRLAQGRRDARDPWPVRFGEEGFGNFSVLDELTLPTARKLVGMGSDVVPKGFPEIETFLRAWSKSTYQPENTELPPGFRDQLIQRLFGRVEGCWSYEIEDRQGELSLALDPLFLLECKMFCEMTSKVPSNIWQGLDRD